MIYRSPVPDVAIPEVAITTYVLRHARRLGAKPALIDGGTGEVLSYSALEERVRRLAGGLVARGFGPGQVLALMAPNCPAFAVVFHGTALAGGTITTLNPTYTVPEIRHQLRDSGARWLVAASSCLAAAREAAAGTAVACVVGLDAACSGVPLLDALYGTPLVQQVPVQLDSDVLALPYSSGTTGLSKGVMLTHRNMVANLAQLQAPLDIREGETLVAALPFFHIYGMNAVMNPALAAGASLVTMARFELGRFLQLHQDHRARRCIAVPPMLVALAKHEAVDDYDLSALQIVISGAAPLAAELSRECAARLCCEVSQGYGMTELSPVSHYSTPGRSREGSVGPALANTEFGLVDPATGLAAEEGAEGEVWIRGPQVMKGYHNNREATAATLDAQGWLHTGDIGRVDADGYLYVVDRLKELIKFKGFQVPPAELEAVLLMHPDVADAAVVGRPDSACGEVPVGFVVLKPGRQGSEQALCWHVAQRVAGYKQLRELHLVDAIPKSASGKILRRMLRERLAPG